jgi:hypothetical protein
MLEKQIKIVEDCETQEILDIISKAKGETNFKPTD